MGAEFLEDWRNLPWRFESAVGLMGGGRLLRNQHSREGYQKNGSRSAGHALFNLACDVRGSA